MNIPCILAERVNLLYDRIHKFDSVGLAFDAINNIYRAFAWGRDNPHPLQMDPEAEPYIHLNTVKHLVGGIARGEFSAEEVLAELFSTGS